MRSRPLNLRQRILGSCTPRPTPPDLSAYEPAPDKINLKDILPRGAATKGEVSSTRDPDIDFSASMRRATGGGYTKCPTWSGRGKSLSKTALLKLAGSPRTPPWLLTGEGILHRPDKTGDYRQAPYGQNWLIPLLPMSGQVCMAMTGNTPEFLITTPISLEKGVSVLLSQSSTPWKSYCGGRGAMSPQVLYHASY